MRISSIFGTNKGLAPYFLYEIILNPKNAIDY